VESLQLALSLGPYDDEVEYLLGQAKASENDDSYQQQRRQQRQQVRQRVAQKNALEEEIVRDEGQDDQMSDNEEIMRGYKKRSDGSVTSYFTREMTAEEKKLAGDFKPKEISVDEARRLADKAHEDTKGAGSWWAGGTWEEENHEKWFRKEVEAFLYGLVVAVEGKKCTIKVESIEKWNGGGYIMVKTGTKKYIVDMSFHVKWVTEAENPSDEAILGTLEYFEITNSELEDGEINPKVNIRTPLKEPDRSLYSTAVKKFCGEIQDGLVKLLEKFKQEK